jgi:hypothetical protein
MGLKRPNMWVNELYQNELKKLDTKNEFDSLKKSMVVTLGKTKAERELMFHDFDVEKYNNNYFDKSMQDDFK